MALYRRTPEGPGRVATSADYPRGPVGTNQVLTERVRTNDLLSTTVPDGRYFLRVERVGAADGDHRVELVTTTADLADPVRRRSLAAPATAGEGVVAVAAADTPVADPDGGAWTPLATSSWGPTADGRLGVDVLAPGRTTDAAGRRFAGTSVAAAYTGGVVARLAAADPDLTAPVAEAALRRTARPAGPEGPDVATGYGAVAPAAALACVTERAGTDGEGA